MLDSSYNVKKNEKAGNGKRLISCSFPDTLHQANGKAKQRETNIMKIRKKRKRDTWSNGENNGYNEMVKWKWINMAQLLQRCNLHQQIEHGRIKRNVM